MDQRAAGRLPAPNTADEAIEHPAEPPVVGVNDVIDETTGDVAQLPERGNTVEYYVECVGLSPAAARDRVETVEANRNREIVRQVEAAAELVRTGRRGGER